MADSTEHETGVIRLTNADEFAHLSQEMFTTAVREVRIMTLQLDPSWLGHSVFIDSLKKAVIENARLNVKLVLADIQSAVKTGHPLLTLIRRLSRFEARVLQPEILEKMPLRYPAITVDRSGIIVRQSLEQYQGFAHFDDKAQASNHRTLFDDYWRYSDSHPDLREMRI